MGHSEWRTGELEKSAELPLYEYHLLKRTTVQAGKDIIAYELIWIDPGLSALSNAENRTSPAHPLLVPWGRTSARDTMFTRISQLFGEQATSPRIVEGEA